MFAPVAAAAILNMAKNNEEMGEDVDEKETIKQVDKFYHCPECGYKSNRRFNRDKHMELIHKVPRLDKPPLYPDKVNYVIPEKKEAEVQTELPPAKLPKQDQIQSNPHQEFELSEKKKNESEVPEMVRESVKRKRPDTLNLEKKEEVKPEKKATWGRKMLQSALVGKKSQLPVLTVYYCGQCMSPNHHRYVQLSEGDAVLLIPICKHCNQLNLSFEKSVKAIESACSPSN